MQLYLVTCVSGYSTCVHLGTVISGYSYICVQLYLGAIIYGYSYICNYVWVQVYLGMVVLVQLYLGTCTSGYSYIWVQLSVICFGFQKGKVLSLKKGQIF